MSSQPSGSRLNNENPDQDPFVNALTQGLPKRPKKTDKGKGLAKPNIKSSTPTPANATPPRGQPLPTDPTPQANNSDEDDHFDSAGILTQFIGPRVQTNSSGSTVHTDEDNNTAKIAREIESFNNHYLDSTQILDRATNHLKSLQSATSDQRTPAKLRITIKPLVIQKDDPTFVTDWNNAIKTSEMMLCKSLIDHLNRVISSTKDEIRDMTDKTYLKIKKIDPTNAKTVIKTGIHQAEADRQNRNKEIQKRKRERQDDREKVQPAKKRRTDH